MKDYLSFLISKIVGESGFIVDEKKEGKEVILNVVADQGLVGLIIGKEGKTIKTLRKLLSIPATKESVVVRIDVNSR